MNQRQVLLSSAFFIALLGGCALLYGFAKIALAEEPRRMTVDIELPNTVALTPPDVRGRILGYRACGVGGLFLFIAAGIYAMNMGVSSSSSRPINNKPDGA